MSSHHQTGVFKNLSFPMGDVILILSIQVSDQKNYAVRAIHDNNAHLDKNWIWSVAFEKAYLTVLREACD